MAEVRGQRAYAPVEGAEHGVPVEQHGGFGEEALEHVDLAQEGDPQGLEAPLLGAHVDLRDLLCRRDEIGVLLQGSPPGRRSDRGEGAAPQKVDIV